MKKIVIMQPTYLPWIGYLDLMDQSDVFVLLDSVQFDKRSWQQRNRIKSSRGELMLSVPVATRGKFYQKICDAHIADVDFYKDHLKAIELNYCKAPYFQRYIHELRDIYLKKHNMLSSVTIDLIRWIKNSLGVQAELMLSSQLNIHTSKVELLSDICCALDGGMYISPLRSREYIMDGRQFRENGIGLRYHQYEHPEYEQRFGAFLPYMSTLDLLFNMGESSMEIIRSGRRALIDGTNPKQEVLQ